MDLTIHHARIEGAEQSINLGIADGKIVTMQEDELAAGTVAIEADGALVSPPFVILIFTSRTLFFPTP